jgi:hypothetical protein
VEFIKLRVIESAVGCPSITVPGNSLLPTTGGTVGDGCGKEVGGVKVEDRVVDTGVVEFRMVVVEADDVEVIGIEVVRSDVNNGHQTVHAATMPA